VDNEGDDLSEASREDRQVGEKREVKRACSRPL
jgi:hypothetical protein